MPFFRTIAHPLSLALYRLFSFNFNDDDVRSTRARFQKKKPTFIKASRFRMNFLIYGARGERPSGEDRLLTPAPSGASSLCEYGRVNAVHPRFGSIFAHWWVTFLNRPTVALLPSPFVALEMPRLTFDCCQFHFTLLDSSVTLIPGRIPKKKRPTHGNRMYSEGGNLSSMVHIIVVNFLEYDF